MIELLTQYGYTYEGSCMCDGTHTEKYSFGEYQVRVKKRNSLFKIKKGGRSITQWLPISLLGETLKTHHDVALQA